MVSEGLIMQVGFRRIQDYPESNALALNEDTLIVGRSTIHPAWQYLRFRSATKKQAPN